MDEVRVRLGDFVCPACCEANEGDAGYLIKGEETLTDTKICDLNPNFPFTKSAQVLLVVYG